MGVTVTNGNEQLEGKVTIFTALLQGTNNKTKKKKLMNWEILEQRKTLKQWLFVVLTFVEDLINDGKQGI